MLKFLGVMYNYRKARKKYLKTNKHSKLLKLACLIHSCFISDECEIGEGTELGYGGIGVVIHKECRIGKGCTIDQNVTLGGRLGHHAGDHQGKAVPWIEDNVYIGAGAVVLGGVTIGHDSIVGANAVVTHSIPPYSIAAGVPARVIKKIDNEKKNYSG